VFLLDEFLVDVRINLRGADVGVAEGHQALLVALADRREPFVVQVQLRKLDAKRFRDAETRAVHEFEKRGVAAKCFCTLT